MSPPSWLIDRLEKLEHAAGRRLIALSSRLPFVKGRSADGATVHPEIALLLQLQHLLGARSLTRTRVEVARARMRRDARVHAGVPIRVGEVRDLSYQGAAGKLAIRHYAPPGPKASPRPLLLFLRGGGFALCDLDTHDGACRALCRFADVHVLSAEYRLAPEHPFPAAFDDVRAALRFAREQATSLGADPSRIAIGGDSAGGNLAAAVTLEAKRDGEPMPALQLLIYPAVDSAKDWPSMESFSEGLFLTRADIHWFRDRYLRDVEDRSDPRVSPLRAPDLSGLPKAIVVTAGFDPLRDEGEAYAEALRAAGNQVVVRRFPELVHGFINFGAVSPASRAALEEVAQLLADGLK